MPCSVYFRGALVLGVVVQSRGEKRKRCSVEIYNHMATQVSLDQMKEFQCCRARILKQPEKFIHPVVALRKSSRPCSAFLYHASCSLHHDLRGYRASLIPVEASVTLMNCHRPSHLDAVWPVFPTRIEGLLSTNNRCVILLHTPLALG